MQGQFLGVLVRAMKARRVLEIGTLGGYVYLLSLLIQWAVGGT
jgi:predicted O-methyltransferase YrrM